MGFHHGMIHSRNLSARRTLLCALMAARSTALRLRLMAAGAVAEVVVVSRFYVPTELVFSVGQYMKFNSASALTEFAVSVGSFV